MLKTSDFDYYLPNHSIASKPKDERSQSKLLVYKGGQIQHTIFDQIGNFLPENSHLILNDSKVIEARLLFNSPTGATIEIFLLEPYPRDHSEALSRVSTVTWKCLVGNRKRWKSDVALEIGKNGTVLKALWNDQKDDLVTFTWNSSSTFAEILEIFGTVPLPPYLNRAADNEDKKRYQTVYASNPGAVAAPTAGLHFSEKILNLLHSSGHQFSFLTLHVGAGTFLPVKTEDATLHQMHQEKMILSKDFIEKLIQKSTDIIAVGTTSMRALESLYWASIKIYNGENPEETVLTQNFPYLYTGYRPTRKQAIELVSNWLDLQKKNSLHISTSIFIRPGYQFGFCDGLITNFHQPKSTLLMLVCALVGDHWKTIYEEALKNDYRFLSFGDSSLLFPIH